MRNEVSTRISIAAPTISAASTKPNEIHVCTFAFLGTTLSSIASTLNLQVIISYCVQNSVDPHRKFLGKFL